MRQRPGVVLVAGLGGLSNVVHFTYAQPWAAATAPQMPWKSVAASADGSKLVAAGYVPGGYSSSSLHNGVTLTPSLSNGFYRLKQQ